MQSSCNPLYIFAVECSVGAYSENELRLAAMKAIERFDKQTKLVEIPVDEFGNIIVVEGGMEQTEKQPSKLKGRKLEPKYKDPVSGKTWAGRGRFPKWMVGKDKEAYKI